MKGDFSRDVFDAAHHYSAVLLEQGCLITDSDWKEQADLVRYRVERETADVIGACGGPLGAAAFALSAGLQPRALDADAASPSHLWIAAEDGYVLHSGDGGASWQVTDTGSPLHLNAVRFSGATGWAAGEHGAVFTSNDLGTTWSAVETGVAVAFRGVALSGASRVWLVGDGGMVVFSTDAGVHWTRRSTESVQLNAVAFQGISNGIAVGDGGRIFATADGGDTWQSKNSGTFADLLDVAFVDATNAWAVGGNGTIVRSTDGGTTWAVQASASTARLVSVRFHSNTAGVVVGSGGVLLQTADAGVTWSAVASGSTQDICAVAVVGNELWYVAEGAVIHQVDLATAVHTQSALPALSLSIGAGRYYVRGSLCEVEQPVSYYNQPDRGRPARLAPGVHLVFVQVWQRYLSVLEAPSIREVALADADPTSRAKTVWQVKTLPLPSSSPAAWNCLSGVSEWDALAWPPGTGLAARAEPQTQPANVCDIGAAAGYRRLENQLYRVEVQDGGSTPTFKWSRENGSVAFAIEGVSSGGSPSESVVRLRSRGRDSNLDLAAGDWVELLDDDLALEQRVGPLLQFARDGNDPMEIVLAGAVPAGFASDPTRHPLLRRWDQKPAAGSALPVVSGTWVELEDGVQVRFESGGRFRPGDYWEIPARTVTGDVVWPRNASGAPLAQPPEGIEDRYCRLGLVEVAADGTLQLLSDCRNLFPPLTMLEQLLYVGGDGQDGLPGQVLAQPLMVRVARGRVPVSGLTVQFSVESGNGTIVGSPTGPVIDVVTDADGIAQCHWILDAETAPASRYQRLAARMLDAAGNPVPGAEVVFAASGSVSLDFIGGDGQGAPAGGDLEQPLEVRVANGQTPFAGAQITFNVVAGGGLITSANPAPTSAQGIASAQWQLGAAGPQRVEAVLNDGSGAVVQRIAFNAQIQVAAAGGGCCDFTIGETGQAKTLTAELIKKLLDEQKGHVCICFLPGEHDVDGFTSNGGNGRLSIHGCGRATLVRVRRSLTFGAFSSIDVTDLSIEAAEGAGMRFLKCEQVHLENLSADVKDARRVPFLELGSFRRAVLSQCEVIVPILDNAAGMSAVFEEGDGTIEISECDLRGIVSFYGTPENTKLPRPPLPDGFIAQQNKAGTSLDGGGGRVRLADNRLEWLDVGARMRQQIELFGNAQSNTISRLFSDAIVDGNSIDQGGGLFIAQLVALSSCSFTLGAAAPPFAGYVAAQRATVVGNLGVQFNDSFILVIATAKSLSQRAANSIFISPPA